MLWFACRGNVYLRYIEIPQMFEDPATVSGILDSLPLYAVYCVLLVCCCVCKYIGMLTDNVTKEYMLWC